jgi:hypothetical protein
MQRVTSYNLYVTSDGPSLHTRSSPPWQRMLFQAAVLDKNELLGFFSSE